jgi:hypothetical protein
VPGDFTRQGDSDCWTPAPLRRPWKTATQGDAGSSREAGEGIG